MWVSNFNWQCWKIIYLFYYIFLSQHIFLAQNLDQLLYIYVNWNASIESLLVQIFSKLFCPLCTALMCLSINVFENAFSHQSHLWSFWPLWTEFMCICKLLALVNLFPHESHLWSFLPLWTESMCFFKLPFWVNDFPHEPHLWSFWPLWTELMCFFKFIAWENAFPQESHLCS